MKRDKPRWLSGQGSVQGFFDFAKSLGAARLAAVTLTLIGFFSFIMVRITTPQMVPLFMELSVDNSALIAKHLDCQAIQYELKNDGAIMMVSKDDVARLRIKLAESDLPKSDGVGHEIFDISDALRSTNFIQNVNHLCALEGELARTIRGIDRVQSVRVHLVLPVRALFSRDTAEACSSIVLMARGTLEPQRVRAIRSGRDAVNGMKLTREEQPSTDNDGARDFVSCLMVTHDRAMAPGDSRIEWSDGGVIRDQAATMAAIHEVGGRDVTARIASA